MGRRTDDDERQIKRWRGVAGEKGRWKRALVNRVLAANKYVLAIGRQHFWQGCACTNRTPAAVGLLDA